MKRITVITIASLAALWACATKQESDLPKVEPEREWMTLTAMQEEGSRTKTVLDGDLVHVLWAPGDAINLFYEDQNECFTSLNMDGNEAVTRFRGHMTVEVVTGGNEDSGMEPSYFWGLYPYSDRAVYNATEGYIETYLPWEQTAEKNTFADDLFISIGRSTSWTMPFYNVCSGLQFTVDQEGVTSVVLRSNDGKPLAGEFRVGFDAETQIPEIQEYMDYYPEVRLYPPEGSPCFYPGVYYYIVTLPGKHENGITIDLEGLPYPASVTTASPVTFNRSRFIATELTQDRYYADILPLESIDLDIENEGVRRYLEEVDYSGDLVSYSESYIQEYLSLGEDKPAPVVFNWKTSDTRTLTICDKETGSIVYEGDASGSATEVYNLVPGREYSFTVEGDISWSSSFTPKGTLRMMDVEGVRNVRDLGGWKAGDRTIRYGRLYRGGQLDGISDNGAYTLLNDMDVKADIDLRGNGTQVFDVNYSRYAVTMFQITGSSGRDYIYALREIIRLLSEGQVVYFHCIYGADRTGTLAFLIEALLGVSESDLSKDFELTSFYELRTRNGSSRFSLKTLIPVISEFSGGNMQEKVTSWAIGNGITGSEIEQLQDIMLE